MKIKELFPIKVYPYTLLYALQDIRSYLNMFVQSRQVQILHSSMESIVCVCGCRAPDKSRVLRII